MGKNQKKMRYMQKIKKDEICLKNQKKTYFFIISVNNLLLVVSNNNVDYSTHLK